MGGAHGADRVTAVGTDLQAQSTGSPVPFVLDVYASPGPHGAAPPGPRSQELVADRCRGRRGAQPW
ncbi:hypothetical protein OF117_03470 [Geodermatophilus sp. YIM 151500]|uniref:hypothetical protein n=1 Tax=Geodermatophilus sp. YIM 151500 TaxID=2984531 RepID=UPI0021E3C368|nr:hypothetical protein [Geodermatophilus sp. YIM 151500]MCV2488411.1 hypothetical protein [Geodermatophilus sp. YIM 151500]